MRTFSAPTQGTLVTILNDVYTHSELGTLLMKADLVHLDPPSAPNKLARAQRVLAAAEARADARHHQALLDLVARLMNDRATNPDHPPTWLDELRERLLADGYVAHATAVTDTESWRARTSYRWSIHPAEPGQETLAENTTALEVELRDAGYPEAADRYRQAVDAYVDRSLENANGALRAVLEDVLVRLGVDHAGYSGSEPMAGLQRLQQMNVLEPGEYDLMKGLWAMSQARGAHRGVTNPTEALFRMAVTTAVLRYMLDRLGT